MATCKECGRRIEFIKMKSGGHMPVDPRPLDMEPDEAGGEVLVKGNGAVVRCRLVEPRGGYDVSRIGYRSHFATCPAGEKVKRAKAMEETRKKAAAEAARKAELEAQGQQISLMDIITRR